MVAFEGSMDTELILLLSPSSVYYTAKQESTAQQILFDVNSFPLLGPTVFRTQKLESPSKALLPPENYQTSFDLFALWTFHAVGPDVCSFFVSGCDHMVFGTKKIMLLVKELLVDKPWT